MAKLNICWFLYILFIGSFTIVNNQGDSIQINTFTKLPKEIEGCSGVFYKSKADRKADRYIFVHDYASLGFVKIGNDLVKFTLRRNYSAGKTNVYEYDAKSFKLKVEIKAKKSIGDENEIVSGTMMVQNSKGQKVIIDFIGDVGC